MVIHEALSLETRIGSIEPGMEADLVVLDARATPAMAQWFAAKNQHPDALLFFRMGDFYEMFFTDAEAAAFEAAAELGAVGEIAPKPIGKLLYWKELAAGRVRVEAEVYPLLVRRLRPHWKAERQAGRVWLPAGEAAERVQDPALAALIGAL